MYNGKIIELHAYPSLYVEFLVVCVCLSFSYTMCVFNMVFNMVSEQAIAGPAPIWVSHLCLWPVHTCKNSWHFCSTQSFSATVFLPHSSSFLQRSEIGSIQKKLVWRRAAVVLKKSSIVHLKVFSLLIFPAISAFILQFGELLKIV